MTEQELEAEYNTAKSEMNWLFEQIANADRTKASSSVRQELAQAYDQAQERRRLAFNAWCNSQI